MKLGVKTPENGALSIAGPVDKPHKESFPSLSAYGEHAELLKGELPDITVGDTVTGTVTLKVTSVSETGLNFDVVSLDDISAGEGEPDGDEEEGEGKGDGDEAPEKDEDVPPSDPEEDDGAEEKVLGYKRPSKSKGPTPPMSAKFLVD